MTRRLENIWIKCEINHHSARVFRSDNSVLAEIFGDVTVEENALSLLDELDTVRVYV